MSHPQQSSTDCMACIFRYQLHIQLTLTTSLVMMGTCHIMFIHVAYGSTYVMYYVGVSKMLLEYAVHFLDHKLLIA